jgi:hypothetical protein
MQEGYALEIERQGSRPEGPERSEAANWWERISESDAALWVVRMSGVGLGCYERVGLSGVDRVMWGEGEGRAETAPPEYRGAKRCREANSTYAWTVSSARQGLGSRSTTRMDRRAWEGVQTAHRFWHVGAGLGWVLLQNAGWMPFPATRPFADRKASRRRTAPQWIPNHRFHRLSVA